MSTGILERYGFDLPGFYAESSQVASRLRSSWRRAGALLVAGLIGIVAELRRRRNHLRRRNRARVGVLWWLRSVLQRGPGF